MEEDEDGLSLPYIVTMEQESRRVLSIRRNYDKNDKRKEKKIFFVADWRSNASTDIGLEFIINGGPTFTFELDLCPEEAYENMIKDAWTNLNNSDFWKQQLIQDVWIHDIMENLSNAS